MKITLTEDNGVEHDITDSIPFMYDAIIQSLDWGSGFLDLEDQLHIAYVGTLAGYEVPEVVELEDYPEPKRYDYFKHITDEGRWTAREREVAASKYEADRKVWEAEYKTRAPAEIFRQLKKFEMDEDN